MPEVWLNYGITDVVLDIQAENLDQQISSEGKILDDSEIKSRLESVDLTKPLELVVLNNSKNVQKVISEIFSKCEEKSLRIPKILTDTKIMNQLKDDLPEGSAVSKFEESEMTNPNLGFFKRAAVG